MTLSLPGKRLLGLGVLAVLGLPLDSAGKVVAVVVAVVFLWHGTLRNEWWRFGLALAIAAVAVTLNAFMPHTAIPVGHNLFLPGVTPDAAIREMPPPVRERMLENFLALHPKSGWCDARRELQRRGLESPHPLKTVETYASMDLCWLNAIVSRAPYAFSPAGLFRNTEYSDVAASLDISGVQNAPLPELHAFDTAWYFWRENRARIDPPIYFVFRITPETVGSRLCSRGHVYFEATRTWQDKVSEVCKEVVPADVGARVWAYQIRPEDPLVLRLEKSAKLHLWETFRLALAYVAIVAMLLLTTKLDWKRSLSVLAWMGAAAVVIGVRAPALLQGSLKAVNERDPMIYLGLGYDILHALSVGHFSEALRGGESIYLFMPGLRYLRALELALFGNTSYGYLLLACLLPLVLFKLAKLAARNAIAAAALLLLFLPYLLRLFGLAAQGYAEPAGYLFLLVGIWLFVEKSGASPQSRNKAGQTQRISLFAACLAISAAVWVRPNLVLVAVALCALAAADAIRRRCYNRMAIVAIGFAPLLLMPLHNVWFGHELVWLTRAATLSGDTLIVTPATYFGFIADLLRGSYRGTSAHDVLHHLSLLLLPLRWALLAGACAGVLFPRPSWQTRVFSLCVLCLIAPFFFYRSTLRYTIIGDIVGVLALASLIADLLPRRGQPDRGGSEVRYSGIQRASRARTSFSG
jgi:hypothetical protein